MQFVAPAQIFLVLWLLAATAPAATALVNGSLIALSDAQSTDFPPLFHKGDDQDATAADERFTFLDAACGSDVASLIFFALANGDRPHVPGTSEDATFHFPGEQPIALSTSVLQTAVQRHRPKVA
jgi:hypothetical protein